MYSSGVGAATGPAPSVYVDQPAITTQVSGAIFYAVFKKAFCRLQYQMSWQASINAIHFAIQLLFYMLPGQLRVTSTINLEIKICSHQKL